MDWISVKDRLPEKSGDVLVYIAYRREHGRVTVVPYSDRYKAFNTRDEYVSPKYKIDGVTHWMPLPEPPKEGNE